MRWITAALPGLFFGYAIGTTTGLALAALMSGNHHDKLQEIIMTAAFLTGPIGAILGLVSAIVRAFFPNREVGRE